MSTTKHTPTPWMAENNQISREKFIHAVGSTLDEADAEFIVRACNNFDQLIEALKIATQFISQTPVQKEFELEAQGIFSMLVYTLQSAGEIE